jgi:spore coat polysaccharide biosynthesis predicted glycosyltransferase SpsG
MTGTALEVMSCSDLKYLEVDIVVGANNPHRESLEKQARERPKTRIYSPRPHLADLMAQADLAIGAGGATAWERMCLGLPSLVVSVAENQRTACEALHQAGMIKYAGHTTSVHLAELVSAIKQFVGDRAGLLALSTQNQRSVDGLGASRVVDTLAVT